MHAQLKTTAQASFDATCAFPVVYCSILLTDVLIDVLLGAELLAGGGGGGGGPGGGGGELTVCCKHAALLKQPYSLHGDSQALQNVLHCCIQGSRLPAAMTPLAMANRHHTQCSSPAPASLPGSYTRTVRVY
jgi:hypothetical protein